MDTKTDEVKVATIDIERAIETVRLFSTSGQDLCLPTLEQFNFQDGKLAKKDLSALEKSFAFAKDFLMRAFTSSRASEQELRYRAIKGTLQQSLDLLKVYSAAIEHMQKGSAHERSLAERVLQAAHTYNELVRQSKDASSIITKIRQFFLKIAGWAMDDALIQNEIHIPKTQKASLENDTFKRLSTDKKVHKLLQVVQKGVELGAPKQQELDLFRSKALSLLQEERIDFTECLQLIQKGSVEAVMQDNILQLTLVASNFPGEAYEIKGAFIRDIFHSDLVIPIKESFQLHHYNFQSGYPHPSQYIGFALSEKLLPNCLLRPHLCPKLQALFDVKREAIQALSRPSEAKQLLTLRKEQFTTNANLQSLLKRTLTAICGNEEIVHHLFEELIQKPDWYEALSEMHARLVEEVILKPIALLQEEWLLKQDPDLCQKGPLRAYRRAKKILDDAVEEVCSNCSDEYSKALGLLIGKSATSLQLWQLSEHFNYPPPRLSEFDKKLLTSLFRQQLVFAYELHKLEPHNLTEHLSQVLIEEYSIFEQYTSSDIVEELIVYYNERYEANEA